MRTEEEVRLLIEGLAGTKEWFKQHKLKSEHAVMCGILEWVLCEEVEKHLELDHVVMLVRSKMGEQNSNN